MVGLSLEVLRLGSEERKMSRSCRDVVGVLGILGRVVFALCGMKTLELVLGRRVATGFGLEV